MKITNIKTSLLGQSVPTNINGVAGRYIEEYMQHEGWPTDLRGAGADVPMYSLEIKSRVKDAVSHHTVGAMLPTDIISKSYLDSIIFEKLQQQFRVITKDKVVVSTAVYDFAHPKIQAIFKEGYETCRQQLAAGSQSDYIRGNDYCFFERQRGKTSYKFRIFKNKMAVLESMAMRSKQYDRLYSGDEL
jgi:hypothetical protein